jgi:hypothetical protein
MRQVVVHVKGTDAKGEELPVGFIPEYANSRNRAVAERIAPLIDGVMLNDGDPTEAAYFVPDAPLLRPEASRLGIAGRDDLFGGVVSVRLHHDKAILHPLVGQGAQNNSHYSASFPRAIESAVLPGYTAFSISDALVGYGHLRRAGYEVRCKDPSQEGGNGQCVIEDERLLRRLNPTRLANEGIVLEPDISDAVTMSLGHICLGGKTYSYYGYQTTTTLDGVITYGGTTLTMVRGEFGKLYSQVEDESVRLAICQANTVYEAYSWYDPILSRANFDIVQGHDGRGNFLSGVVDQSLRIGGASPAEVLAISALEAEASLDRATAQIVVMWNPTEPPGSQDVLFFDDPRRRDVARIVSHDAQRP